MKAENCSGVIGVGSAPTERMRSATSGSFSVSTNASFNFLIMSAGVPAGAITPYQPIDFVPFRPSSSKVGISGRLGVRLSEVTAIGFTAPPLIWPIAEGPSVMPSGICPATTSAVTGPLPR